jgi:uncharacterized protein (AIM24 family)
MHPWKKLKGDGIYGVQYGCSVYALDMKQKRIVRVDESTGAVSTHQLDVDIQQLPDSSLIGLASLPFTQQTHH